jgi:hypothetical protein
MIGMWFFMGVLERNGRSGICRVSGNKKRRSRNNRNWQSEIWGNGDVSKSLIFRSLSIFNMRFQSLSRRSNKISLDKPKSSFVKRYGK